MKRPLASISTREYWSMYAQPGAEALVGGRRDMTVSFADLVGFTGLSER
jgi:class 3 adenylate cyclase